MQRQLRALHSCLCGSRVCMRKQAGQRAWVQAEHVVAVMRASPTWVRVTVPTPEAPRPRAPARQAPATELIGREEALAHEAESAEVAAARDAFVGLRRQLVSLRAEVNPTLAYTLMQCYSCWLVAVRFGDGRGWTKPGLIYPGEQTLGELAANCALRHPAGDCPRGRSR